MKLNVITEESGDPFAAQSQLRIRLGGCPQSLAGALVGALFFDGMPASADEPVNQLERARLVREQQEAQPPATTGSVSVPSLPWATLQTTRRSTEGLQWQQLNDSQWRKLLSEQQMQVHQLPTGQPLSGGGAESLRRAQTFDREHQAQVLSADILRRDQECWQGMRL